LRGISKELLRGGRPPDAACGISSLRRDRPPFS
jgi:hypothetical protein